MLKGHPRGLLVLFLANMGERFGWYTMLSVFTYFLMDNFCWDEKTATSVYGYFLAGVYFMPLVGGLLADRLLGYGRTIAIGSVIMAVGYALLAIPTRSVGQVYGALAVICVGYGMFKGNLVVLVGNLYDQKERSGLRDAAFNLFYMGINVGAFFAPYAASFMRSYLPGPRLGTVGGLLDPATAAAPCLTQDAGYNGAFAVAGVAMLVSLVVFLAFRKHYAAVDLRSKDRAVTGDEVVLTPRQERDRIVALLIVFGIVVFFWMAFQQSGASLSLFARYYTQNQVGPITYLLFDLPALLALVAVLLGGYYVVAPGQAGRARALAAGVVAAGLGVVAWRYAGYGAENRLAPELFQAFNPIFIVFLTPVVVGAFSLLAARGREPSSPGKIGIGMVVTAAGFAIMVLAAWGLARVSSLHGNPSPTLVSPYWLISTFFTLTVAELFLSPMGLSFVSRVAPPRLKGLMQGGWLAANAVGNYLAGFIGRYYQTWELWQFFALLVVAALLSALAVALVLRKLKAATTS
jgi:POT family proton-dependent oligopeptide transporter